MVWIYIILTALYLIESLAWVRAGGTALPSVLGRFSGQLSPRKLLGNERGFVSRFGPLPLDVTFVSDSWPLSIADDGVVGFVATCPLGNDRPRGTDQFFSWAQLSNLVVKEKTLVVGDLALCELRSGESARELAAELKTIAAADTADRTTRIDQFVADRFSSENVAAKVTKFRLAARNLKLLAMMLGFWIFVIGIARYQGWLPGFSGAETLAIYLAVLVALWWGTNVELFLAHRRLYPLKRGDRWKLLLTSIVSPAVPLRGTDHLARHLLSDRHPLAVAAVIFPPDSLQPSFDAAIRDIHFPLLPPYPADAPEVMMAAIDQYRTRCGNEIQRLGEKLAIDTSRSLSEPTRQEPEAVSYCPRCHQEFAKLEAICTPCGDRVSIAFAGPV